MSPTDLLNVQSRAIVTAAAEVHARGYDVTPGTVAVMLEELGRLGDLGEFDDDPHVPAIRQAHAELQARAEAQVTAAGIELWADKVREMAIRRAVCSTTFGLGQDARDIAKEPAEFIRTALKELTALSSSNNTRAAPRLILERIDDDEADLMAYLDNPRQLRGYPTHIRTLDDAIDGFEPGRLYVIAARTSMGKTAFALNCAAGMAESRQGRGGPMQLYVSLEMRGEQLLRRLTWARARISPQQLRRQGATFPEQRARILAVREELAALPFLIDDSSGSEWASISERIEQSISRDGAQIVWLDHVDLVTMTTQRTQNRHSQIAAIMSECKALALKHQVPFVVLSQVNRVGSKADDGIPTLADLRESGSKEEDADTVLLLHRPAYAQTNLAPNDPRWHELDVIIGKQRDGQTQKIRLWIDLPTQRIGEWEV